MEIVAELVYAGRPMAEIAGLDDMQLREVYGRRRDKWGRLVRPGKRRREGIHNPVSFEYVFKEAKRTESAKYRGTYVNVGGDNQFFAGWSEQDIESLWQDYLKDNPGAGHG